MGELLVARLDGVAGSVSGFSPLPLRAVIRHKISSKVTRIVVVTAVFVKAGTALSMV
jgi:hypothetical protein